MSSTVDSHRNSLRSEETGGNLIRAVLKMLSMSEGIWFTDFGSFKLCGEGGYPIDLAPNQPLLAGEVVHRHRVLKQRVIAGHDGDAAIGDEVAGAVGFGVVADGGAFGQVDVAIDDAAADAAMASHDDVGEQD